MHRIGNPMRTPDGPNPANCKRNTDGGVQRHVQVGSSSADTSAARNVPRCTATLSRYMGSGFAAGHVGPSTL